MANSYKVNLKDCLFLLNSGYVVYSEKGIPERDVMKDEQGNVRILSNRIGANGKIETVACLIVASANDITVIEEYERMFFCHHPERFNKFYRNLFGCDYPEDYHDLKPNMFDLWTKLRDANRMMIIEQRIMEEKHEQISKQGNFKIYKISKFISY